LGAAEGGTSIAVVEPVDGLFQGIFRNGVDLDFIGLLQLFTTPSIIFTTPSIVFTTPSIKKR
jgi:hypothetical protein